MFAAVKDILDLRYVAPFRHEGNSKATGVEYQG